MAAPSITLSQESEIHYWTHELGVDERLLRHAIASVGPDEIGVRGYLLQARTETCVAALCQTAGESERTLDALT